MEFGIPNITSNPPAIKVLLERFFSENNVSMQRMDTKIVLESFGDTSAMLRILCCHISNMAEVMAISKMSLSVFLAILSTFCYFFTF